MPLKSGMDLLVALLYAPGASDETGERIRGITRLEKLVFLILEEGGLKDRLRDYRYEPYELGPYSREVVDYLETLKGLNLVAVTREAFESHKETLDAVAATGSLEAVGEPGKVEIYELTGNGRKVGKALFDGLNPQERGAIVKIKKQFNTLPLPELLKLVYKRYPGMTKKSKILDEVLGVGARRGLRR